jgi:hypothetical protein
MNKFIVSQCRLPLFLRLEREVRGRGRRGERQGGQEEQDPRRLDGRQENGGVDSHETGIVEHALVVLPKRDPERKGRRLKRPRPALPSRDTSTRLSRRRRGQRGSPPRASPKRSGGPWQRFSARAGRCGRATRRSWRWAGKRKSRGKNAAERTIRWDPNLSGSVSVTMVRVRRKMKT